MPPSPPLTPLDRLINVIADAVEESGLFDHIADMLAPPPPPAPRRATQSRKRVSGRTQTPRGAKAPRASQRQAAPTVTTTALYDTLQVSPSASLEVIKAAYRSLSRLYHPDVPATGSAVKMRALNGAYEILSDPKKRKEYDARR
jgi:hypothetical protein